MYVFKLRQQIQSKKQNLLVKAEDTSKDEIDLFLGR